MPLCSKKEVVSLLIVFLISFAFHLFNIQKPNRPAFDEVHFATYAAEYARHEAHFDIHPPLGKLLYAAVLSLYPSSAYQDANFIAINTRGELKYSAIDRPFGNYPYVALRILASLFGALLPILGYVLLKNLTQNPFAPPLAAFFLLFENALLMETRLILLNGMMLVFGILALIFFFGKKQRVVFSGICLGLALSVKLSAFVFAIVLFFGFMLEIPKKPFRAYDRDLGTVGGVALLVLGFFVAIHILIVSPAEQISVLRDLRTQMTPGLPAPWNTEPLFFQKIALFFKASIEQFNGMVAGYVVGTPTHVAMSPWYAWPFMSGGFSYSLFVPKTAPLFPLRVLFGSNAGQMGIVGNIFVWLSGTVAVLWSVWFSVRSKFNAKKFAGLAVLLAGWVAALLPFVSIVRRTSFLYHYFPALIFSILLLAHWVGVLLTKLSPLKQKILLAGIFLLTLGGFVLAAPYTYGL
ncbi:MAG: phospholipid carrier-dependent glycosyltransferase [Patescibacteria group bacterium]